MYTQYMLYMHACTAVGLLYQNIVLPVLMHTRVFVASYAGSSSQLFNVTR